MSERMTYGERIEAERLARNLGIGFNPKNFTDFSLLLLIIEKIVDKMEDSED